MTEKVLLDRHAIACTFYSKGQAMLGSVVVLMTVTLLITGCGEIDPVAGRARLHLPPEDYVPSPANGRKVFLRDCSVCHGQTALGTQKGPPLIHKTYRPNHHPDMAFHLAVKDGVRQHHWNFGDMPPQLQVSPEETEDIVSYIRDQQREQGIK